MNATLVIANRELRDKSRVFLTAAALALLPFLAALLPGAKAAGRPIMIALVGGMLSVAMALGVAAILGGTTIGRELTEGRLSFYFSKPVPAASIWFGKAIAAIVAAFGSFLIIAVPSMLVAGRWWTGAWTIPPLPLIGMTAGGAIVLFLLIHAMSTMIRSRSVLIGVDFACAVIAAAAIYSMLRPLVIAMAGTLTFVLVAVVGGALLLILAIAPAWQLERGRTDRRRSHAALSRFLWPAVFIVLAIAGAFVVWVVSASPEELTDISAGQSTANGWTFMTGRPPGRLDYHASFIIAPDGRARRTPPLWWGADFSRDGRVAVWAQPTSATEVELQHLDLATNELRPTGINADRFVISDDGTRIAAIDDRTISVHDLGARRMLASASLDVKRVYSMLFVRPDLVRVYEGDDTLRIFELDVAKKTFVRTGEVETNRHAARPIASPDGSRLWLGGRGLLVDGRSGAIVARYPTFQQYGTTMLRDGTVVTLNKGGATIQDPRPVHVAIPDAHVVIVQGEIAPGKLLISGYPDDRDRKRANQYVVDRKTGAIERVAENLRGPLTARPSSDPRPMPLDTGRPLLMLDAQQKLVTWNPRTGETKPFLR